MMKRILKIVLIAIIILLLLWGFALVKCEILTHIYYDDFEQAYAQNTMIGEIEYFKVLKCNGNIAEVYYVGEGMSMGNVLTFENNNGIWSETSWNTIWSTSGSASDVIYPYWWHFIYGGL